MSIKAGSRPYVDLKRRIGVASRICTIIMSVAVVGCTAARESHLKISLMRRKTESNCDLHLPPISFERFRTSRVLLRKGGRGVGRQTLGCVPDSAGQSLSRERWTKNGYLLATLRRSSTRGSAIQCQCRPQTRVCGARRIGPTKHGLSVKTFRLLRTEHPSFFHHAYLVALLSSIEHTQAK